MLKKFLATSAIALLAGVPAVAGSLADPIVEPMPVMPVYEPASDWTGFYAGANGGLGITGGVTYWGAGVHAGYLHDMGDFVLGGELSYNYVFAPATDSLIGFDAILGYDAGDVMPHVTLGGSYLFGPGLFGISAGGGLTVKATEEILLTARYRFSYAPATADMLHQGILAVSYRF